MSSPNEPLSPEQLTSAELVADLQSVSIEEVRRRRGLCQDAEELLSLRRRLVQGRLDIVQAELYRRAGGASDADVSKLVESLPTILVEHGDRHLGPGRFTSLDASEGDLGHDFDAFVGRLDQIVNGQRLSALASEDEGTVRQMADQLDAVEREVSKQRHELHRHIDLFQEEIVRRYKAGEANVDTLLEDDGS